MINVAILGYGTVGSGVAEVIQKNAALISRGCNKDVNVKYILDLREFPGDVNEKKVVHDFDIILNDPEVSVVCETMGGTKPAYSFTRAALEAGKCVCTSNKELVEAHGAELFRVAKDHGCRYLFEASAGGGIPLIRSLTDSFVCEKVSGITGIVNGTTNYILDRMDTEGADFETVLKDAQALGYAEKDPTADIEGYDACRKIAILTSLILGKKVDHGDIYTEGITKITSEDFAFAKQMGMSVKLLAMSRIRDNGTWAMVAPFMIGREHPLYSVRGVFNAVYVQSDMLDGTMFYGRGAGKLATASAVVSDVIDCVRHPDDGNHVSWSEDKVDLLSCSEQEFSFFIKADKDTFKEEKVREVFGDKASVIKLVNENNTFGIRTKKVKETFIERIMQENKGLVSFIRMMD